MNKQIQVRRLTTTDIDQAKQTIRSIKERDLLGMISSLESLDMQAWLANPAHILVTASADGVPIGFALGYLLDRVDGPRPMLFFYEIEVASECRRRGIGKALVAAMRDIAREAQVAKMWVQTSPSNVAARALYRSAGGIESEHSDLLIVWTEESLQ